MAAGRESSQRSACYACSVIVSQRRWDMGTGREDDQSNGVTGSAREPRVMTRNEAAAAYPNEWIFMQVTQDGDDGWPRAGIVLAHHPKRWGISDAEIAVMSNPPDGAIGYSTFYGVPLFRTHEEAEAYRANQRAARDRRA